MTAQEFFKNDRFATNAGVELIEIKEGYSKARLVILRSSGPGDVLYAEARERYIGRTTGYYQIDVTNQEGKLIATFESSVFRKGDNITFSLPQTSSDSGCPGHS